MANDNKKYIPALRFPEFQNDGEWSMLKLGKFAKIVMGQSPSSEAYNERGEGVPLLQGNADIKDRHQVVRVYTTDITKTCDINDIIMTVRAPVGTISRASFKSCIGRGVCAIKTDSEYLYQYLISIEQEWDKLASGSTFVSITSNQIFDRIIFVPLTIQEQKKIADCLSSLDKYIDATKRKLKQLKEHKKGLMQKLFPAKGKTLPELRFPEFQNDGEWAYDYGDALFDSIVNKNHNSELPILAITQENGAVPRDMINYRVVVEDKSIEGYKVVDIGDFIISLRTFQGGIEYSMYKGICSPAYIVLRKKHNNICNDFYRHYFKSFQYIQDLNRNLEGIRDGKMVSYKQFSEIKIPYPRYEEQCKVANCLTSLDMEINALKDKIMALEIHKNGLMQQLFPKL